MINLIMGAILYASSMGNWCCIWGKAPSKFVILVFGMSYNGFTILRKLVFIVCAANLEHGASERAH